MSAPTPNNNNNTTAGGPKVWRKAIYSALAILSFLYLSITILLFYVRRKKIADIRYRPLRLNVLNVVATIMLCMIFCLSSAFYPDQFPCVLVHWIAYIGVFLYCSSLTCRVLSFSWVAKYNLAKLRMSMAYTPHQSSFNFSNGHNNNAVMPNPPTSPTMRERLDFPGAKWLNRLKRLRQFTTDKWLAKWILCPSMGFAFILALIIQIVTPDLSLSPLRMNCKVILQSIPVYILVGAFLVIICPILIFLLYGLRDAYGLRNELMVTLFSGMFAYAGYFIFELILPRWKGYLGSFMLAWLTLILCHTLSITMPVIRSFKGDSDSACCMLRRSRSTDHDHHHTGDGKSKRYALFEKVLGDSELFEHYKICAAACFCTELMIFLQEYQFLKMLVAHCCTPTNKEIVPPPSPKLHIAETGRISFLENTDSIYSSPASLISPSFTTTPCTQSIVETVSAASWIPFPYELRADYNSFYETFFDPDSDLAINFSGNLLNDVKNMIAGGKYELNMYEQARDEVLNLLYRNTFERFLKMCEPEITKKGLK